MVVVRCRTPFKEKGCVTVRQRTACAAHGESQRSTPADACDIDGDGV